MVPLYHGAMVAEYHFADQDTSAPVRYQHDIVPCQISQPSHTFEPSDAGMILETTGSATWRLSR